MKIEFEIPDKTMEKYTKPLSMWHHWRSSMSLSMIIWAILKLSAPTIIGWTLLWVFFGIVDYSNKKSRCFYEITKQSFIIQ